MWTLWLVSEVFQRPSLRNQSSWCIPAALTVSLVWNTNTLPRGGGEATGYRAATFFPRRFIEHVKYPPPSTHSDNQLWKYFSNVKCPNASEAMQAIPSGSRIRAGVCTLPVPAQQTSLNPTGCFSAAAARYSLSPQCRFWTSANHILYSQQCQEKKNQGQERRERQHGFQYNGRADGRKSFTTLRGWWRRRGGTAVDAHVFLHLGASSCAPSHRLSQLPDWKLRGHFISSSADMSVDCPAEQCLTFRQSSDAEGTPTFSHPHHHHLPRDRPAVWSTII